jgi:hypothetical protein
VSTVPFAIGEEVKVGAKATSSFSNGAALDLKLEHIIWSETEDVEAAKGRGGAVGWMGQRAYTLQRIQPPCHALVSFGVQWGKSKQGDHEDISFMAVAPGSQCPPCGQFTIIGLDHEANAKHHNKRTFVAVGEVVCNVDLEPVEVWQPGSLAAAFVASC